jgi:transcriptional regulator with GAF, ATPase, and Fis domain
LLMVLQEGEFERVGEERTRRVNVRVIAATNRDLEREIVAGRFRKDLYYRLNTFPIEVPPLRDRRDDIPLLVAHFLERARRLYPWCGELTLPQSRLLESYDWPGNIRELRNVVERAVIISQGGTLRLDLALGSSATVNVFPSMTEPQLHSAFASACFTHEEMKHRERENILLALQRTGWKLYGPGGAAALLGLKPNTLAARLKVMGIQRPN